MGWSYVHRPRGLSNKEFFEQQFNAKNENGTWRVLDCKTVQFVSYLAIERTYNDGTAPIVFGVVCLTNRNPKNYYNFGYKAIDENMGPYECKAPEEILNLLTPTDNEEALEWRKRCRGHAAKSKTIKISAGMIVQYPKPLKFTDGVICKKFEILDAKKGIANRISYEFNMPVGKCKLSGLRKDIMEGYAQVVSEENFQKSTQGNLFTNVT